SPAKLPMLTQGVAWAVVGGQKNKKPRLDRQWCTSAAKSRNYNNAPIAALKRCATQKQMQKHGWTLMWNPTLRLRSGQALEKRETWGTRVPTSALRLQIPGDINNVDALIAG